MQNIAAPSQSQDYQNDTFKMSDLCTEWWAWDLRVPRLPHWVLTVW